MSDLLVSTERSVLVPAVVSCLQPWVDAGVLGAAEVHVAGWVARTTGVHDPAVLLGAAITVWAAANGHSCLDLGDVERTVLARLRQQQLVGDVAVDPSPGGVGVDGVPVDEAAPTSPVLDWPAVDAWRSSLVAATAAVRTVTAPDPFAVLGPEPLVLCGQRLYLQRYWVDECTVAAELRQRAAAATETPSPAVVELLEALLPAADRDGKANLQRTAAELVLRRRVSLVVGGPGTGKTYSIARVLAALAVQAHLDGRRLRIALAAPTGKAATRMGESIAAAVELEEVRTRLPEEVLTDLVSATPTTIHRLLGPLGRTRQRFVHDRANPLPHDVVIIDEMSMVSLPLLARLCEALSPSARVVLVGDPDQLESVELGAVLGDLVDGSGVDAPASSSTGSSPLAGHVVRLQRARRYEVDSPIALLADAVRSGDSAVVLDRLRDGTTGPDGSTVRFVECGDPRAAEPVAAVRTVVEPRLHAVREAALAGDADAALTALQEVRVLCAHRRGPHGVSHWNHVAERWMYGEHGASTEWFPGRPVLITRNDPRLGLANGDTGVVVATPDGPRVAFRRATTIESFDPVELESGETAFAMTVHKSQGSEFPHVVLVMPPDDSPLVGRELLYTAVTRARKGLLVVGHASAVTRSVTTTARRMTGLTDALS